VSEKVYVWALPFDKHVELGIFVDNLFTRYFISMPCQYIESEQCYTPLSVPPCCAAGPDGAGVLRVLDGPAHRALHLSAERHRLESVRTHKSHVK